MMLTAYAQATQARQLQVWVGVFDADAAPATISFLVNGKPIAPTSGKLTAIRDGLARNGTPLNYRGVFVLEPAPDHAYHVEVATPGAQPFRFRTAMLPDDLPVACEGSFNILLSSCYYRPRDAAGLAAATASLGVKPNLTLLAGDQVYGDLPLLHNAPRSPEEIRAELGMKYRLNWASPALGSAGLGEVLVQAPVVCVPDDHEYWNNYPFRQAQLADSWWGPSRRGWMAAARELYADYQVSEASSSGAARLDVGPLKMLFLDMRSDRDEDFRRLMAPPGWAAFDLWVDQLIAEPGAVGLLSSGQALLVEKPNALTMHMVDAEMPNYEEFGRLCEGLAKLANARVPLLYVTGDVHWGRISEITDLPSGRALLHEVIASPSVLIDTPFDAVKKLFGFGQPWPRHSESGEVPGKFGPGARWEPRRKFPFVGDQVAVLGFSRSGGGVNCQVTYYNISSSPTLSAPRPQPPIQLRRL